MRRKDRQRQQKEEEKRRVKEEEKVRKLEKERLKKEKSGKKGKTSTSSSQSQVRGGTAVAVLTGTVTWCGATFLVGNWYAFEGEFTYIVKYWGHGFHSEVITMSPLLRCITTAAVIMSPYVTLSPIVPPSDPV